ncbi:MAG: TolC family protein [Bacteroidota bacterium]|nr:TolC family protein [Bacteroidota bacterium]
MKTFSWQWLCVLALPLLTAIPFTGIAQSDTTKLTVAESETIFLKSNFSLLAAKYNIDANRALIRQAKLWDNPVLSTDQNIYDNQGKFFAHNGTNGQVYLQVTQLIKTAGKRNKLVQLAADNTSITSGQFDDLVRTLRYELITDLFEIEHQLKIRLVYSSEINELQTLINGMDEEFKAGNISLKDNLRVKALLFSLQNDLVNVDAQILPLQQDVKLLLNKSDNSFVLPAFHYYLPDLISKTIPTKDSLEQIAFANRPDMKIARLQVDYAKHNLMYQKALAKPDINIGTEYDQRSSYAPNYVGLAVSLPLNILNKNQGNISSARFTINQQEALYDGQTARVRSDITAALDKIKFFQQINNTQQLSFAQQYESVFQNMLKSYKDRQVSLLEFIDFADAYNETRLKILEQHTSLIKAFAELNYVIGEDVINLN